MQRTAVAAIPKREPGASSIVEVYPIAGGQEHVTIPPNPKYRAGILSWDRHHDLPHGAFNGNKGSKDSAESD